ncbi:MAG: TIM barrel protein, partial [Candidatus Eremiobacteraeota bacterium]|nr:TIM barrel protein [Candidatus Eremiobacteraeota bacterium]
MSDPLRLKRAVYWSALPRTLSYRQRFALALKAGFAGVETLTTKDPAQVEAIAEAAAETGLEIPTVINGGSWRYRLFSDERSEVDQAVDSILTTLDNARRWGAGAIQIIPAYGQGGVALPEAYRRTQQVIRERVLPVAESYGIVCGVENAWYSLVPGPLAYLRFIDE